MATNSTSTDTPQKAGVFETLNAVDVNEHTERKVTNGVSLTYLSWAWAWAEAVKRYPSLTFEILQNAEGLHYFASPLGIEVRTRVTIEGQTREMWLPVMNGANRALKCEPYEVVTKSGKATIPAATMTDINKAIMRCLVKNLAMFGLGLYIYAGEDLPEGADDATPAAPTAPRQTPAPAAKPNPAKPSAEALAAAPTPIVKKRVVAHEPNARARAAWQAFSWLENIKALDKATREEVWAKTLTACTHKARASEITTDAEWDKVDSYIKLLQGEVK